MSEPSDADGAGTPRTSGATNDQAPTRASAVELRPDKLEYPDDGPLATALRKVDTFLGIGEQAVLVALFATLVVLTAGSALLDKLLQFQFHQKDDVIRGCTFGIAMLGAAFASHQGKQLALDLISRKFPPRARLVLNIFLGVFTLFILVLFIRSGLKNADIESKMADEGKFVSNARLAWLIPIGGVLLFLHTLLHTLIDVDYVARNKLPPERVRAH